MRSLLIVAAVLGLAIALGGCHDKKPEPVPGPQSAHLGTDQAAGRGCPGAARNLRPVIRY